LEENILDFAQKTFIDIFNEKKNELNKNGKQQAKDDKSYMLNLTTKIIDNLEITVSNIHIRYEDTKLVKQPLSMGITLQKMQINTTDEKWKNAFFDRTVSKNKLKPIMKVFQLFNFGLYCNPKDMDSNMIINIIHNDADSKLKRM
jgi:vacuolar protein sorting-associated protein 13A/C